MAGFLDYLKDAGDWLKNEENEGTVGLLSLLGGSALSSFGFLDPEIEKTGYQGEIPDYTAVRERVQDTYDPNRRPGSGGQRFFSDTEFAEQGQEASAKQRAVQQALNLKAQNAANMARQSNQFGAPPQPQPQMPMPVMGAAPSQVGTMMPPPQQGGLANFSPQYKYGGGIAALAGGGAASAYNRRYNGYAVGGTPSGQGYYLGGATDGMADKVPATIDGMQEARLSDGEFVVPADVVSHLGNGNSNAGANTLYGMMDKVRQARTGNKEQGKEINPNKFIPSR
ncbi:MAG: hypothetical protein CMJ25_06850 [Phycisphaerae bacterium]|nr:hypothetical protein [Phycisphaerae bacterium]|tara:strand:- start:6745 stop:7590 length:846 start_codon:yes stop_codon:yes gene_type:complete